jgi:hypothetical protein
MLSGRLLVSPSETYCESGVMLLMVVLVSAIDKSISEL